MKAPVDPILLEVFNNALISIILSWRVSGALASGRRHPCTATTHLTSLTKSPLPLQNGAGERGQPIPGSAEFDQLPASFFA